MACVCVCAHVKVFQFACEYVEKARLWFTIRRLTIVFGIVGGKNTLCKKKRERKREGKKGGKKGKSERDRKTRSKTERRKVERDRGKVRREGKEEAKQRWQALSCHSRAAAKYRNTDSAWGSTLSKIYRHRTVFEPTTSSGRPSGKFLADAASRLSPVLNPRNLLVSRRFEIGHVNIWQTGRSPPPRREMVVLSVERSEKRENVSRIFSPIVIKRIIWFGSVPDLILRGYRCPLSCPLANRIKRARPFLDRRHRFFIYSIGIQWLAAIKVCFAGENATTLPLPSAFSFCSCCSLPCSLPSSFFAPVMEIHNPIFEGRGGFSGY